MLLLSFAIAAPSPVTVTHEPGSGFAFTSEDGRFGLRFKSRLQLLYSGSSTDGSAVSDGFNLRRARLDFSGHGFGTWNHWRMQLGVSDADISRGSGGVKGNPLLDAYWELRPDAPVKLRIGQFKVPSSRARIQSTATLEFVDRHELDAEFTFDRDRGATVRVAGWRPDGEKARLRAWAGVFKGAGRTAGLIQGPSVMSLARIEMFPLGTFAYYADADLQRSQQVKIGMGGGFVRAWNAPQVRGGVGGAPSDGGTTDMNVWTADTIVRFQGVSLEGSIAGRSGVRDAGSTPPSAVEAPRNALGFVGQLGVMLPRIPVSVSGRYTSIDPVGDSSYVATEEIGGAASWYISGHAYNLAADFIQLTVGDTVTHRGRLQLELAL